MGDRGAAAAIIESMDDVLDQLVVLHGMSWEQYEQIAYEIPVTRFGWSLDRIHDLDMPFGELLLATLCGAAGEL